LIIHKQQQQQQRRQPSLQQQQQDEQQDDSPQHQDPDLDHVMIDDDLSTDDNNCPGSGIGIPIPSVRRRMSRASPLRGARGGTSHSPLQPRAISDEKKVFGLEDCIHAPVRHCANSNLCTSVVGLSRLPTKAAWGIGVAASLSWGP
jgi:hypothetical protein